MSSEGMHQKAASRRRMRLFELGVFVNSNLALHAVYKRRERQESKYCNFSGQLSEED